MEVPPEVIIASRSSFITVACASMTARVILPQCLASLYGLIWMLASVSGVGIYNDSDWRVNERVNELCGTPHSPVSKGLGHGSFLDRWRTKWNPINSVHNLEYSAELKHQLAG